MNQSESRWFGLALLVIIYVLNFLDRTLIFVLFPTIKAEFHFSDLQLALLGSTSFVIFYTLLGVPFGRMSDRVNRVWLIAGGLFTWSLFSGLTALCHEFSTLFLCRLMVGVGEATLGPSALSLLSDWFEPKRRATVQSLFTLGIPVGAGLAFFLGGAIGQTYGWRMAFLTLGFPGVILALAFLKVKDPARKKTLNASMTRNLFAVFKIPALRSLLGGYAAIAIASNAISMWLPIYLIRTQHLSLMQVGKYSALSLLTFGALATALGGAWADKLRLKDLGGRLLFSAIASTLASFAWFLVLWQSPLQWWAFAVLPGLGLIWLGAAAADVHELVLPEERGIAIAWYYLVVNGVGYGFAPPVIGYLSDRLGSQTDPIQMRTALLVCPVAALIGSLILLRARQQVRLQNFHESVDPLIDSARRGPPLGAFVKL